MRGGSGGRNTSGGRGQSSNSGRGYSNLGKRPNPTQSIGQPPSKRINFSNYTNQQEQDGVENLDEQTGEWGNPQAYHTSFSSTDPQEDVQYEDDGAHEYVEEEFDYAAEY